MFNNFVRDAQGFCVDTIATKFSSLRRKRVQTKENLLKRRRKKQ
jgi:hypothetical protein